MRHTSLGCPGDRQTPPTARRARVWVRYGQVRYNQFGHFKHVLWNSGIILLLLFPHFVHEGPFFVSEHAVQLYTTGAVQVFACSLGFYRIQLLIAYSMTDASETQIYSGNTLPSELWRKQHKNVEAQNIFTP